jgi:hypothetical protein
MPSQLLQPIQQDYMVRASTLQHVMAWKMCDIPIKLYDLETLHMH